MCCGVKTDKLKLVDFESQRSDFSSSGVKFFWLRVIIFELILGQFFSEHEGVNFLVFFEF